MEKLLRFPTAVPHDPAIDAWMAAQPASLAGIAGHWFGVMRGCGDDVRELLHDGHPTACVGDAAFGYVNAFTAPSWPTRPACCRARAASCATSSSGRASPSTPRRWPR
jgi:hypothetical protein